MSDDTSAETPEQSQAAAPAEASVRRKQGGDGRRRKRRRGWHVGFWMILWLALGLLFLMLAGMSVTGRVVQLPDWMSDRIEARLNNELQVGSVQVSWVEFGVSPAGHPRLSLVDTSLRDGTGLEIAQVHRLQGAVRPFALLQGRISPSRLYLSGAQVTVRRRVNGELDLTFGQSGGASGDLASVLDAIDTMFAKGPLAMTENIDADALTITLEDARSGRLWQVTDGRLKLTQTEKIVDISVTFDVFNQTEELAEMVLGFRTDKATSEASFGATFANAAAADIAAQSPLLAFLGVIDAPISGALRSSINADGEISELAGTLQLGAGALSPANGATPVPFDQAKVYINYRPEQERIDFNHISVRSELGEALGSGHVYLRDFKRGWPATLLGQFQLSQARIRPDEHFATPILIDSGAADFRLRLDPFTLEIGQLVLEQGGRFLQASGEISAGQDGWALALDGSVDRISKAQGMALWPVNLTPITRDWVQVNIAAGEAVDVNASLRLQPGGEPRVSLQAGFVDGIARVIPEMPPITGASGYMSIEDKRFMLVAESGQIEAASGGSVDIGGTVYTVPQMQPNPPAVVDLKLAGAVGDVLSLLELEPFNIFKNSDFGPDLAEGQVRASGRVDLVVRPVIDPTETRYEIHADLSNIRSEVLVPGRVLTMARAELVATHERVEITGAARLGQASASGTWFAATGADGAGSSRIEASVALDQGFIDEFNIGLPPGSVSGEGVGQLEIDFVMGQAPAFELVSDLNRMRIRIADLNWSKPGNRTGLLRVSGRLGEPTSIDQLVFEAPGLSATGRVSVLPDGGLEEAVFSRVRLGGWLDAPVTFTGRGGDRAPVITISGGSVDMRRAQFSGSSEPGGGSGSGGQDAPINLTLDRLIVSEAISLTSFSGQLNRRGGMQGTFSALVNGGPAIRGVVAPQQNGSAVRITSNNAGGVLKAAGVFKTARGGNLTLILAPRAGEGVYDGDLKITRARVVGASALAELLSALSIVGLLEQLGQEGIAFSEIEARFRMTPEKVTIQSGSAVGASLGISLDGTFMMENSVMDMAGVISPLYIFNALGQIFTRKGEGLIGFTYTMRGTPDDPSIAVNPLSLFTPAMFREIFRRPPPELPD